MTSFKIEKRVIAIEYDQLLIYLIQVEEDILIMKYLKVTIIVFPILHFAHDMNQNMTNALFSKKIKIKSCKLS